VNSKGLEQSATQQRIDAQCVSQTASEQTAMSNKSEIPPAVAEFALEQLTDLGLISRYEVTAENLEVLRARLARYEDEDGNPKAQPNTPVSAKDAPYMSDDTDPREAWADGYNAAVEEQALTIVKYEAVLNVAFPHGACGEVFDMWNAARAALGVVDTGATEPQYTANLDVRDLIKDAD
jgi:hypothetical protein